MGNALAWFIAVLLLSLTGGCSRSGKSNDRTAELSALNQAYQSGVLNKDEYAAKKAGLESQAGALDALDKALAAGVVSQTDYRVIKSRLIAKGSALASLESARRAGVFTQEEYLAKKTSLLTADSTSIPSTSPNTESAEPTSAAAAPQRLIPVPLAPQPSRAPAPVTPLNGKPVSAPAESVPPPGPMPAGSHKNAQESGSDTTASSAQSHVLRMKMATAIDQSGFERPMPSLSVLVPADWQSQGGTTWNIKDKCNTIRTSLRATGSDGRAIEVFPAFNWVWADDPQPLRMTAAQTAQYGMRPCDVAPPMSAADFLRRNLGRYRPNAQLVGFEPAPKVLEALQRQARQGEQAAVQYNLKQNIRPDAVKGRLRYTLNGKAMEEWMVVATIVTGTLGPVYNTRSMQMGQAYSYSCVAYVTGERAPQGQLDASENLFELIVGTARINPAWQAKINGQAQAIQAIDLKGVRDRSAIVTKNAEDIRKLQQQTYENQQRSQDRTSDQFSQTIRGVETYRNPSTGETVELSNQYGQAWINNRGEYLLSDQPGFDPSVTFKEDWKPLEKIHK